MRKNATLILSATIMFLLLINSDIIRSSAYEGLDLCIRSVIPSLFPFLLISTVINGFLQNADVPGAKVLCKLCKTSTGCGSLILLGLLGGYPVGAKCINDSYKKGYISKAEGHRLLAFCSNAGPSFIFGIISVLFSSNAPIWALWSIHILSALLVGVILPETTEGTSVKTIKGRSNINVIADSIKTMSIICSWVIIFKIILSFCEIIILNGASNIIRILCTGILELTNGCIQCSQIQCPGLRFILCSIFLSFGGICVTMQTISVTKDIGIGKYFYGKFLQTLISFIISYAFQYFYFPAFEAITIPILPIIAFAIVPIFLIFYGTRKKLWHFTDK